MSLEDQYDTWVRGLMGGGRYAATPKQAEDANDAVQQMQAQLDALTEAQKRQTAADSALNAVQKAGAATAESVRRMSSELTKSRIVAGTYLMAAAATRGEIILENPPLEEMDGILDVYRKMGGQCRRVGGKLIVNGKNTGFPLELLETEVYPGFPTDLQSPAMAVLATIPGVSRIREKIFEDRYKTASWLCKMGAQIQIRDGVAVIYGGQPLTGCTVEAEELRGGAALVIAALAAQGITRIRGCCFIERGYEHICEDLTALGGLLIKDRGTL